MGPIEELLQKPAILSQLQGGHVAGMARRSLHHARFLVGSAKDAALGNIGFGVGIPVADHLFQLELLARTARD
eukprot:116980-Pyramimonas_sp.AAC.1